MKVKRWIAGILSFQMACSGMLGVSVNVAAMDNVETRAGAFSEMLEDAWMRWN